MNITRKQRDFKKLVAKDGDEYLILDYIFKDKDFQGATGTRLRPVPREEYEERTSTEAILAAAVALRKTRSLAISTIKP